ncbi:MAG: RagB/SusD family nutrient uptake outer membrane protein [Flavobacteriaceae bacterium]
MNLTKYIKTGTLAIFSALTISSCIGDLDQTPIDPDSFTELDVFADVETAKGALAKLYNSIAITGQDGPAGDPDLSVNDEGASQYTRLMFGHQTLSTDEAVNGWGDGNLSEFHAMNWSTENGFVLDYYNRLGQSVSFANSFIANCANLEDTDEVRTMVAEARFLRAYHYYNLMDTFGNVPIVTEIKTELPQQNTREEVFNFIEAELMEIIDVLPGAKGNEYGRVDKVAAQALLSRMYLNAESFIGIDHYNECITYSMEVINSGYSLHSSYQDLFLSDNDMNGAQNENIFVIRYDGLQTQTYGGTTFFIHANFGGSSMNTEDYGSNGGWAGNRTTKALVEKFEASSFNGSGEPTAWSDSRAMFYSDGQSYEINDIKLFADGYAVTKYRNIDSDGNYTASDPTKEMSDIDQPLIRMGEIYLNYAEAVVRGGGGSESEAVSYINELRARAYSGTSGAISTVDLNLNFILDERARELYHEGMRRTDLIRHDKFTQGTYLWPFKGDVMEGVSVESYRELYPLPANVLLVNDQMTQNEGY